MMNKQLFFAIVAAALLPMGVMAQDNKQNLNKEITLEKDFTPTEKKATKKNELPKVKKTEPTHHKSALSYSDRVSPIDVPTSIPTMMPYGYRTAHNFSDKRGYLNIGGGTQANFNVSLGYRILEDERQQLAAWLQHNSTWAGKNNSKLVPDDDARCKQKFNDNTLGIDYRRAIGQGTFNIGAKGHIDIYNYYGGWKTDDWIYIDSEGNRHLAAYDWNQDKQTFYDLNVYMGWASTLDIADNPLHYSAKLLYGHAAYDKSFNPDYKHGAHDNWGTLTLAGSYELPNHATVALDIKGEYLNRGASSTSTLIKDLKDEAGMITLSPRYNLATDLLSVQLGLNGHISFSDGATLRLSPNVRFNLFAAKGITLFANALGGKSLGYRVPPHYNNWRYDNPLLMYGSVYTPLDAEGGVAIGPFQGFSAKLSIGYGIVKDQPGACYYGDIATLALSQGLATRYYIIDGQGYYVNAEVKYRYRSLAELSATVKYAPHDDELYASDGHYNGYKLGVDRASTLADINLRVTPIQRLAVNLGLEYRGGRMALLRNSDESFTFVDMRDVVNLHAGASYRLTSTLSVWLKASNLLNRRYDMLYGMGAQRLNLMGGVNINF